MQDVLHYMILEKYFLKEKLQFKKEMKGKRKIDGEENRILGRDGK